MNSINKVKTYRELEVWKEAIELTALVYRMTEKLPDKETYGLISQMKRAAVSIPANIAEGWGRMSKLEFRRFTLIARGSAMELETHLLLSVKLNFIKEGEISTIWEKLQTVNRLLAGTIRSLSKKI